MTSRGTSEGHCESAEPGGLSWCWARTREIYSPSFADPNVDPRTRAAWDLVSIAAPPADLAALGVVRLATWAGPWLPTIRGWNALGELVALGCICTDGAWSWAGYDGGLLADPIALMMLRDQLEPDLESELEAIIIADDAIRFLRSVAFAMRSRFIAPVLAAVDTRAIGRLVQVRWPSRLSIVLATSNDEIGSAFVALASAALPAHLRLERMEVPSE